MAQTKHSEVYFRVDHVVDDDDDDDDVDVDGDKLIVVWPHFELTFN